MESFILVVTHILLLSNGVWYQWWYYCNLEKSLITEITFFCV